MFKGNLVAVWIVGTAKCHCSIGLWRRPLTDCIQEIQQVGFPVLQQLQNLYKVPHHLHLLFQEASIDPKVTSLLETSAPDQLVPGKGTLQDISSQLMHLGEVQGGLEVQGWQELVHQLGRLPELLCCLRLSAIHLADKLLEHWLVAGRPVSIPLLRKISVGLAVAS